jgi:IS1 family transposase
MPEKTPSCTQSDGACKNQETNARRSNNLEQQYKRLKRKDKALTRRLDMLEKVVNCSTAHF